MADLSFLPDKPKEDLSFLPDIPDTQTQDVQPYAGMSMEQIRLDKERQRQGMGTPEMPQQEGLAPLPNVDVGLSWAPPPATPLVETPEKELEFSEKIKNISSNIKYSDGTPVFRGELSPEDHRQFAFIATSMVGGAVIPKVLGGIATKIPAFAQWAITHPKSVVLLQDSIKLATASVIAKNPEKTKTRAAVEGVAWAVGLNVVGGIIKTIQKGVDLKSVKPPVRPPVGLELKVITESPKAMAIPPIQPPTAPQLPVEAITPAVGGITPKVGVEGVKPPAVEKVAPAKEPWEMNKKELKEFDFKGAVQGQSMTPRQAFKLKDSKEQVETLYDAANETDKWRINEITGKNNLLMEKAKNKNNKIKIYRSSDIGGILPGSYVSESKKYVTEHGESNIPGRKYKIHELEVYPDELVTYDDPHEFIYIPRNIDIAHKRIIQQALSEGNPVPANVLADYPDLKAKPAVVARETAPSLEAEARKYKTAEEFVKGQGKPIYHGTSEIIKGELKFPLYLTENKAYADVYQSQGASSMGRIKKGGGEKTYTFYKAPKERILDIRNSEHLEKLEKYFSEESVSGYQVPTKTMLPDWTEAEGIAQFVEDKNLPFDALLIDEGGIPDPKTGKAIFRGIGYVALNKNAVQTKSQLTDIYNKAKGEGKGALPVKVRATEKEVLRYSRAEGAGRIEAYKSATDYNLIDSIKEEISGLTKGETEFISYTTRSFGDSPLNKSGEWEGLSRSVKQKLFRKQGVALDVIAEKLGMTDTELFDTLANYKPIEKPTAISDTAESRMFLEETPEGQSLLKEWRETESVKGIPFEKLKEMIANRKKIEPVVISEKIKKLYEKLRLAKQGETKIGRIISEEGLLSDIVRGQEMVAREKFIEGKKLGIYDTKEHFEEVVKRAKERTGIREKINKMIGKMKAINIEKLSPQEAGPIKDLLKDLDLVKRQKPTILKLARTREFMNTNPDAEMPDYMLEKLARLDKRNLNNITLDELETVYHSVMHYTHLNKVKNQIKVGREFRRAKQVLADSIVEMKPPRKVKEGIIQSQKSKIGKIKNTGRLIKDTFGIRHDHYDLVIESLAGANSTMDKVLYQGVKEGIIKQMAHKQEVFSKFQKDLDIENFLKKYKIKDIADWQNETVETGRFNFTKGERMSLYRHSLNKDNLRAIVDGGFGFKMSDTPNRVYKITPKELDDVIKDMTPAEKEFAGTPIQNLFDNQHKAMSDVFYEKNGYPMPKETNYYPKSTMPLARGMDIEKETALERFKGKWTRVGLEKGMLEKRLRVQLPLYLNNIAYDVNRSVLNASAYIGLELPLTNASKLLYNRNFRAELSNRYSYQTWIEIEKGLRDIAGDYQSYSTVEQLGLKLKNKLSSAILGFNPFVMAKQILSFPLYSVYVNPKYLMQGAIDYIFSPNDTIHRHKLYSPEYLERVEGGYDRDVSDVFKTGATKRLYKGETSVPEKLMGGIKLFDRMAVEPGMQGAVLQVLDELKTGKLSNEVKKALDISETDIPKLTSEDKMRLAYKFADYVTERTQPMFSPEHRSSLSRGSSVEKLATQFSSFTNQALNLIRRTWRAAEDGKDPQTYGKLLKSLFLLLVVNTGGVMVIDEVRDRLYGKKKKKEGLIQRFGEGILDSTASYFYFIRDLERSVVSKVKKGTFMGYDISIPVLGAADTFADTLSNGFLALTEKNRVKRKKALNQFIDGAIQTMMTLNGLPYTTPKKMIGGVINKKHKALGRR